MGGKKKKSKDAPFSVFTAADNIKYRGYRTAVAAGGGKSTPMSKEMWVRAGRPSGT